MGDSAIGKTLENPQSNFGSGLKRKIESGLYELRVGSSVLRENRKPNYSEDEVLALRSEEERKGNLLQPPELGEAIVDAKERFMNMFGGYVDGDSPIFNPERQFVFKKKANGKELHIFKDKIRGIDTIKTSEAVRQENIKTRHPDSLGTHFRGITMLSQIDEDILQESIANVRSRLVEKGFSPDIANEKRARRLIYSTVLVHEWTHAIDRYFTKPLYVNKLAEPITYWFDYQIMTAKMPPQEKAISDALNESYFKRGPEFMNFLQGEPKLFERIGGIDRIKQIMTTGKVNANEARLFLHVAGEKALSLK